MYKICGPFIAGSLVVVAALLALSAFGTMHPPVDFSQLPGLVMAQPFTSAGLAFFIWALGFGFLALLEQTSKK